MKYVILFGAIAVVCACLATQGGWRYLYLWPAISFFLTGTSYVFNQPTVFGKRDNGTMNLGSVVLLLPYLILLYLLWHAIRLLSRESPVDLLDSKTQIGRRLLPTEVPNSIANIVDLTCEFFESKAIVAQHHYVSFPILDGSTPSLPHLWSLIEDIEKLSGSTLIHCAQGHGRTGLVAACLLIYRCPNLDANSAIAQLKEVRANLDCNRKQIEFIEQFRHQRDKANVDHKI